MFSRSINSFWTFVNIFTWKLISDKFLIIVKWLDFIFLNISLYLISLFDASIPDCEIKSVVFPIAETIIIVLSSKVLKPLGIDADTTDLFPINLRLFFM